MLKQIREFSLVELLTNLGVPHAEGFLKEAQGSLHDCTDFTLPDGWTLILATGYSPDPAEFSIVLHRTGQKNLRAAPRIALTHDKQCGGFSLGRYAVIGGMYLLYPLPRLGPIYALLKEDTDSPASTKLREALAPFFTEE